MKLIDKSALVAEIEKRIEEYKSMKIDSSYYDGMIASLEFLRDEFIDILEAKEVDLETQIDDYINSHFTEGCDGGMISDWYKVLGGVHYKDLVEITKHFFELGLKAQKGE